MNFEQAQSQAIRTKEYFPFRIVWIKEVDNGVDDALTGCWVWDEDKLSYSEASERYPLSKYKWEFIE